MSRVLVIGWSQSGQVGRAMEAFARPFREAGHEVVVETLRPVEPYPFPWKVTSFFGVFPETVLERPRPIERLSVPREGWDLVVLASQVWFLSPSQPFAALLTGPDRDVVRGRRVITLVACRNMWVRGWRRLVQLVEAAGGRVTDRVVATHAGNVTASYFSTLFWMLTGRRDAIKALPAAGLGEDAFAELAELGRVAAARLGTAAPDAPLLADRPTAGISHAHALGEQIVGRIFPVLARGIAAISRPGTALRGVCAVGVLGIVLGSLLTLFVPCVGGRYVLRKWVDPWLEAQARLPVLPTAAPSR